MNAWDLAIANQLVVLQLARREHAHWQGIDMEQAYRWKSVAEDAERMIAVLKYWRPVQHEEPGK